ncbi:Hypothetical protein MYEA_3820 [Mycoplasma yeatsii 13926]|uniref:Type IV toxin-antitoxin system AbiEi family antitoxin domain-containing protein n=1 Tax=Mycoplasma yeatsii 13926 TaxID=1188240 RepID=S6G3W9_9MOLU|nr:DUF6088 family protein [Mycoplasma yeatsii]EOA07242.1 Hypothetical protein MYEA_3820 [Mycoplasma yeatsii 13926]
MTYISQIQERIDTFSNGKVFTSDDFLDIASSETVRRTLNKLVKEQKIRRVMNGFYYSPRYSELIKEYEQVRIEELAKAVARKHNWDIAPFGLACLNILGLSTQVPVKTIYVSSGKTKIYKVGKIPLEFRKVSNKEISNMSLKTRIVIQAIKELGKGKIEKYHIDRIRWRLTEIEKQNLLVEARHTTKWIYEYIKEICKE